MHITIKMTMITKAIKAAIGNLFLQMKLYNYKQKSCFKNAYLQNPPYLKLNFLVVI